MVVPLKWCVYATGNFVSVAENQTHFQFPNITLFIGDIIVVDTVYNVGCSSTHLLNNKGCGEKRWYKYKTLIGV